MSHASTATANHRAATLWLASTLVLFAALAPSLGMLLRSTASGLVVLEVCSTLGGGGKKMAAGPASHTQAAHCPLCMIPSAVDGPTRAFGGMPIAVTAAAAPDLSPLPAIHPATAHLLALSRAPPTTA